MVLDMLIQSNGKSKEALESQVVRSEGTALYRSLEAVEKQHRSLTSCLYETARVVVQVKL